HFESCAEVFRARLRVFRRTVLRRQVLQVLSSAGLAFAFPQSGRLDSNQRPLGPEPSALSQAELRPALCSFCMLVERISLSTPCENCAGSNSSLRLYGPWPWKRSHNPVFTFSNPCHICLSCGSSPYRVSYGASHHAGAKSRSTFSHTVDDDSRRRTAGC